MLGMQKSNKYVSYVMFEDSRAWVRLRKICWWTKYDEDEKILFMSNAIFIHLRASVNFPFISILQLPPALELRCKRLRPTFDVNFPRISHSFKAKTMSMRWLSVAIKGWIKEPKVQTHSQYLTYFTSECFWNIQRKAERNSLGFFLYSP